MGGRSQQAFFFLWGVGVNKLFYQKFFKESWEGKIGIVGRRDFRVRSFFDVDACAAGGFETAPEFHWDVVRSARVSAVFKASFAVELLGFQ